METKLRSCKEEKARLLEDIVEIERQIMLWEKKITLEKETQKALDPELGQSEARAMEREIHRMTLRYDTLQADQKRMIEEMERCIAKREAIGVKHRGNKKKGEISQQSLKKKLSTAKENYASISTDVRSFESAVKQKMTELEDLGALLEAISKEYSAYENTANSLQSQISSTLYMKQRAIDQSNKFGRIFKRYEDVQEGRAPPVKVSETEEVEEEAAKQEEVGRQIHDCVRKLQSEHAPLKEVLERVNNLATA
jgi:hypothetical protein